MNSISGRRSYFAAAVRITMICALTVFALMGLTKLKGIAAARSARFLTIIPAGIALITKRGLFARLHILEKFYYSIVVSSCASTVVPIFFLGYSNFLNSDISCDQDQVYKISLVVKLYLAYVTICCVSIFLFLNFNGRLSKEIFELHNKEWEVASTGPNSSRVALATLGAIFLFFLFFYSSISGVNTLACKLSLEFVDIVSPIFFSLLCSFTTVPAFLLLRPHTRD